MAAIPLLLLVLQAASAQSSPEEPSVKSGAGAAAGGTYAIVLGSGKTEQEAQEVLQRYRKAARALRMPNGFPKLAASDHVAGLEPGLRIALLGYCPSEERARMFRDLLDLEHPGVSIKKVAAGEPLSCPALGLRAPSTWVGFEKVEAKPLSADQPQLQWEAFTKGKRCSSVGVRLKWGTQVVAEKAFVSETCDPKANQVSYAVSRLELAGRTFWLVRKDFEWGDGNSENVMLVGFACGEVRVLHDIAGSGSELPIQIDATGPDSDRLRDLTMKFQADTLQLHWDAAGCDYRAN